MTTLKKIERILSWLAIEKERILKDFVTFSNIREAAINALILSKYDLADARTGLLQPGLFDCLVNPAFRGTEKITSNSTTNASKSIYNIEVNTFEGIVISTALHPDWMAK